MARLSLSLLGSFQVSLNNKPIEGFDSAKSRALLAYLAEEPGRTHSRSTLACFLWPERPEGIALGNLRHVIANLRQVFRDSETLSPFLIVERESIALNLHSECSVDTLTFRQLVSASLGHQHISAADMNCLKAAASLYRGEFLDSFSPGDSSHFEEWILNRREFYHSQFLDVLYQLAEVALSQGDTSRVKDYARQQLVSEPWREEAHCQLMEALALEGKRCEALAQYSLCCSTLEKELNVGPSQATLLLYECIRKETMAGGRYKRSTISTIPDSASQVPLPTLPTRVGPHLQEEPDLSRLRADYLAHLQHSHHALDFKGIPHLSTLTNVLALEDVYIPLLARPELPTGESWERRRLAGRDFDQHILPDEVVSPLFRDKPSPPVEVEDVLLQKSRLVVLGDPGSGKTTLLKHIALNLAKRINAPLPILIPLNAYARALSRNDYNLHNFLHEYYSGRALRVATLEPLFDHAIRHGQAVILLDGLDEVQNGCAGVVSKIEDFADEAVRAGNKIVVTSRIVGYRNAPLAVEDWALYTLLDFNAESIEQFAIRWCRAFEISIHGDNPEALLAADKERRSLLDAIESNSGVARLASNPLLLTILALLKRQGMELPRSRIKLYERYLETLIEAWNRARALDKTPGSDILDYGFTLDALGPLALRLHEENPTSGLVFEHQLLDWLKEYFMGEEWGLKPGPANQRAIQFINDVRQYSNLLLERGEGQFGFIHLTFEEALAAYGLVSAGQVDLQRSLAIIQSHLTDPAWFETIRLALGVWGILHRQPLVAGEVLRAMLKMDCGGAESNQNVLLAGACLEDEGELGSGSVAASEVIASLKNSVLNRTLPPASQRDAGFILGRLAANFPPLLQQIRPDLDDFIMIEPGEFRYGGAGHPEGAMIFSQPFRVARYPVTNLQYHRFLEAGGYARKEFWSYEGWNWRFGQYDQTAQIEYQDLLNKRSLARRGEPYYWHDTKWNNPLSPVIGITWFEAEAYCRWLTIMRDDGERYRLPSEEEWECAARGCEGRLYAWGNDYDLNKFNSAAFWNNDDGNDWVKDINVSSTTIVGQFPEGRTPDGIYDLTGNVWEWTASWYDEEQVHRVVRGASWGDQRKKVQCAYRDWLSPVDYVNVIGFRIFSSG